MYNAIIRHAFPTKKKGNLKGGGGGAKTQRETLLHKVTSISSTVHMVTAPMKDLSFVMFYIYFICPDLAKSIYSDTNESLYLGKKMGGGVGGGKRKAGGLEELDNPKNTKRAAFGELTNAGNHLFH